MFAFYVTGASVRVWMGNEAPFCFSPSLLSQKSFIQGFPEPSGMARKRGERERKTRRSGSYFPDFFLKKKSGGLKPPPLLCTMGRKPPGEMRRAKKGGDLERSCNSLSLSLFPLVSIAAAAAAFPTSGRRLFPSPPPPPLCTFSSLHPLKDEAANRASSFPPFSSSPKLRKKPRLLPSMPAPLHISFYKERDSPTLWR